MRRRAPDLLRRAGALASATILGAAPVTAEARLRGSPEAGATIDDAAASTPADEVLVLPIEIRGAIEPHVAAALETRLEEGLRRADFEVFPAARARALVPAGECGGACLRELAAATHARHLVRARLLVEGRDYTLIVELVRPEDGAIAATSSEFCEVCGHEELAERVDDLVAALRRKLRAAVAPPPRLRVLGSPEGSVVSVDGVVVGVTPVDVAVAVGEHDVVVHHDGFVGQRQRLAFVDGVTETLTLALAAVPAAPTTEPPSRRLAPLGWASIAVGLAATGSGVALVALDERPITRDCTGPNIDAEGHCRWRYDTLAGGVALTVVGVAAVAIGAAMVAIDRRRGRRSTPQVAVSSAGLGLRF